MGRMILLLIIAGLLAAYGGYSVVTGVRKIRKPRRYASALVYWEERPGGMMSQDFAGWLGIFIHRLALIAIGVASLVVIVRRVPAGGEAFTTSTTLSFLADLLMYGAVGITFFAFGFSFLGPLAEDSGGDHQYAVSEEGLLMGGLLLPWNAFTHYTLDTERTRIYIWSASLPGALGMVAEIPDHMQLCSLAQVLRAHLPEGYMKRPFGGLAFPLLMFMLCAPFVLAAWWLSVAPHLLALISNALLVLMLLPLGGQLINRLVYGSKGRPIRDAS